MSAMRIFCGVVCVAALSSGAQAACFKVDHDGGALGGECGYAAEVKVYAGPSYDFSSHSWIADKNVPTEAVTESTLLDSPEDCQRLCAKIAECDHFAYEPSRLCVLKRSYDDMDKCHKYYKAREGITAGPAICPQCFQEGYDFGAVGGDCGYAPEVKIFAGPSYNFSQHSWIASKNIPAEAVTEQTLLDSPADCQMLCLKTEGCDYFAYEPSRLCVLKRSYADMSLCVPHYKTKTNTTSGPRVCEHCLASGMDVAAGNNVCGYAKEIKMYAGEGYDFSQHSWLESKGVPSEHTTRLQNGEDCAMLCHKHGNCAYFVYNEKAQGIGRCMLKEAYASPLCTPLYKESADDVSGTAACGGNERTCGDVKMFYKAHSCCGNPEKHVHTVKI